ncbi:MAG: hypothetical protein WC788_05590 [Candidatus Paceibacterota bacterium]|jgi:hypothetical protein
MADEIKTNQEGLIAALENMGFEIKNKNTITLEVTVTKGACVITGQKIRTEKGEWTPENMGYKLRSRRWDILFSPIAGKDPNGKKTDLELLPDELKAKLYGYALCMELMENIKLYNIRIELLKQTVEILKEKADEEAVKGDVSGELYARIRDFEKKVFSSEFSRDNDRKLLEKNIPLLNGNTQISGMMAHPFKSPLMGNKEKLLLTILEGKEISHKDLL